MDEMDKNRDIRGILRYSNIPILWEFYGKSMIILGELYWNFLPIL